MNRQSWTGRRASGSTDAGSDLGRTDADSPEKALSRRKIFKRAVLVTAVGAAGGTVLGEAFASPASAAPATTVEQGAVAPTVVFLTDAATIAVNASLGNDFRVTLGGNHTMGSPSNPVDGQQIVFQVTQGTGGPYTITWDSGYEFSTGLPQPTLSTTAGQTDLLGFVYNTAMGTWLLASFVKGFSSTTSPSPSPTTTATPTPTPTPTPTTTPTGGYRLFPSTNGPSTVIGDSGDFGAGVLFEVTQGGMWFEGYWWWVANNGDTAPQKFALWSMGDNNSYLINAATVTSGTLTAGQWNYIPLPTPVQLSIGGNDLGGNDGTGAYIACTVWTMVHGFSATNNQFGSGDPYSAGITQGPLFAFSDQSGSAPCKVPGNHPQGLFGGVGNDPTNAPTTGGSGSANFWMDVQVSNTAPSGYSGSYRLWPNMSPGGYDASADAGAQTTGTCFSLSKSCVLDNVRFYSPHDAAALPTSTQIWNSDTKTLVSGTNLPASWSGGVGSGWVANSYANAGITLPAGNYIATVYYGGGQKFYLESRGYFGTDNVSPNQPGAASSGFTNGPLATPGTANAPNPPGGNSCYFTGGSAPTYPNAWDEGDGGENRWVDVEVTPTS